MSSSHTIGNGVVERCLKPAGARSVWLVRLPDGTRRTVKGWPLTLPLLLRALVGQAQPQRQRRAATRLVAAGIPSPRVRSGPRLTRRDGTTLLEIELDYVEGSTGLEILREGDPTRCRAAAAAIAELLRRMIVARLHNRDLKLSNIVLAPARADDGSPSGHPSSSAALSAWLIDPVALRRMRHPRAETARMLERLAIEPREAGLTIPTELRRTVVAAARDGIRSLGTVRGGR